MEQDAVLIKNGTVIDPANKVHKKLDVALLGDKIIGVGDYSKETTKFMIDAEGCLVTPGLIDHHAHIAPLIRNGIPAEAICFAAGVTTIVDAGSNGCLDYEANRTFLQHSKLTIKPYINIYSKGLTGLPELEDLDPSKFDEGALKELFAKYPGELQGLKIRTSKPIVKDWNYKSLAKTVEIADRIGVPVMVHCTNPPGTIAELLSILRPGDVMTHMYQNIGHTLLDDQKKVIKEAYEAREKGILFEAADARAHFSFEVSEPAIKEGFLPDFIGTDLTVLSMYQRPTSFSLAMQISKYAFLGIPFDEVIKMTTINPAKDLHLDQERGSLTVGHKADVAIFKKIEHENEFGDRPYYNPERALRKGNILYKPMLTIKDGQMVFRDMLF